MLQESDLKARIKQEIDKIEAIADLLPSVIIIHHIKDSSIIWMCENGLKLLGITLKELKKLSYHDYYTRFFNLEDAKDYDPKLFKLIAQNNFNESVSFLQQVRLNNSKDFTWHISSSKILMRDNEGKPLLLITLSFPTTYLNYINSKAEKILKENIFLRKNATKFAKLSGREREVLAHLAKGKSAIECGKALFISPQTVETHRKNIRMKLDTKSFFELTQYARSFDLI
jgi:DNA-binding CsgD family transcriptional regulator